MPVVKRYFQSETETYCEKISVRETEVSSFDSIKSAKEAIFLWKLADQCDGYEIIDCDSIEEFHSLRTDPTRWQEYQNSITERWYDRDAVVHNKQQPGSSVRMFMR